MISPCLTRITDGVYRCQFTGVVVRSKHARILCGCSQASNLRVIQSPPSCPFAAILGQLTPAGVDRLQRCRAAGCGLIHQVDGHTTCVGMGGTKCGWLARWAACLNGTKLFPNGTERLPALGLNAPFAVDLQAEAFPGSASFVPDNANVFGPNHGSESVLRIHVAPDSPSVTFLRDGVRLPRGIWRWMVP